MDRKEAKVVVEFTLEEVDTETEMYLASKVLMVADTCRKEWEENQARKELKVFMRENTYSAARSLDYLADALWEAGYRKR